MLSVSTAQWPQIRETDDDGVNKRGEFLFFRRFPLPLLLLVDIKVWMMRFGTTRHHSSHIAIEPWQKGKEGESFLPFFSFPPPTSHSSFLQSITSIHPPSGKSGAILESTAQ